jgi:hypothetical protein
MMTPELLHTSGSRLIMYMFELIRHQLRAGKDCDDIDQEHIIVSNIINVKVNVIFPKVQCVMD